VLQSLRTHILEEEEEEEEKKRVNATSMQAGPGPQTAGY
jgi:hypothetical protein